MCWNHSYATKGSRLTLVAGSPLCTRECLWGAVLTLLGRRCRLDPICRVKTLVPPRVFSRVLFKVGKFGKRIELTA